MGSEGVGEMNDVPVPDGSGDNNGNDAKNPSLRNAKLAQVDSAKFDKYSMDPNNPNNQGKWKAFEDLGYNVHTLGGRSEGAQDVIAQIEDQLPQSPATLDRITPFGRRYEVDIEIEGPNGRKGILVTIWQYNINSDFPRLITNWLEIHKREEPPLESESE